MSALTPSIACFAIQPATAAPQTLVILTSVTSMVAMESTAYIAGQPAQEQLRTLGIPTDAMSDN